ncbi:suppressor of glycerol defect [Tulasnella sp. 331]|nr:suppressor of glycerol defect [Tulasnella sp. 331]
MPQNTRPIRLPRALRDELAEGNELQHSGRKGRPGKPPPLTRKESRKQARQDRKSRRSAQSLSPAEKQEDDEIAWLEAKLKLKKGKDKTIKRQEEEDDEDDLDDFLDRIVNETRSKPSTSISTLFEEKDEELLDVSDTLDSSLSGLIEGEEEEGSTEGEPADFDDMGSEISDTTDFNADEDKAPTLLDRSVPQETRPSILGHYVPPALRKAANSKEAVKTEAQIKLSRQLKGLLNKLSEQNISTILLDLEDLYRENTRNDVTVSLTLLIIKNIASPTSLLDTFVILHAALVSSMHRIVGVEFAAHFLQSLIDAYEGNYVTALSIPSNSDDPVLESPGGKAASNLLTLIAQLYTFQVISCVLIYDIIRTFLGGNFGELEVELFLNLLKAIGPQLRQDDPAALKEIITLVQTKTASTDRSQQSSRTRFMLETLYNLKNNKTLPGGSAGQKVGQKNANAAAEAVDKMKRLVKSLGKGGRTGKLNFGLSPLLEESAPYMNKNPQLCPDSVRSHDPLNVTLEDLHSIEKRGKWWLVGSAWAGDPLVDATSERVDADQPIDFGDRDRSSVLLKLAKKQGMNTDVRRSIFVVLMSSDDYIEACDRLLQLKIGDQQRAEIVRVILHCCSREKSYNPYYTLVGQHLSGLNRDIMFAQQYCLWDLFREMGEPMSGEDGAGGDDDDAEKVPALRIRNYARTYAWWVAKGALAMTILKPLNFTALRAQTIEFLRIFLAQLIVSSQSASPILDCATRSDKDAMSLSRDRSIVELIMVKAFKQPNVVQGLIRFLKAEGAGLEAEANVPGVQETIVWGLKVTIGSLSVGDDLVT